MKVKEGKRLICPGLCSRPSCSRESSRNRERKKETGTQVSGGARMLIEFCKSKYTVLQGSFFR